jgi:hypothetical protein
MRDRRRTGARHVPAPTPPETALSGRQLWAARQSRAINWYDLDDVPTETLNRILWWDAKGYDKPYPKVK